MPYLFRQRVIRSLLVVAALCSLTADECSATGRWNLPSTANQYMGFGFGAGYHAPLVMGHSWRGKAASPGVRRVPEPLKPPCCSIGMAPYQPYSVQEHSVQEFHAPLHNPPAYAPSAARPPAVHPGPSLLFDAPAVPTPTEPLPQAAGSALQQSSEFLPAP